MISAYLSKATFLQAVHRPQLLACFGSAIVLALVLALLWLGNWLKASLPERIEVREVVMFSMTPPPPPPSAQRPTETAPVRLQIQGAGPKLEMMDVVPQLDLKDPEVPIDLAKQDWQSLEIDWDAFNLHDLDQLPTLLTPVEVKFPRSLVRRGVTSAKIRLEVIIGVDGKVTLVEILQNPHPELVSEIRRGIAASRFSVPQKNGEPVRARFAWAVEIRS